MTLVIVSPAKAKALDDHTAPESYSEAIWDYLTNGSSLTVGIGGREADLTVKASPTTPAESWSSAIKDRTFSATVPARYSSTTPILVTTLCSTCRHFT